MKRLLTEPEKKLVAKNIQFIEENLVYDKAIEKQVDVQIEIAPIIFTHQVSEMKKKREGLKAEIEEMEASIKILNEQLKTGVEVKEEVKK